MKFTEAEIDFINEYSENNEGLRVYEGYSGRGMFGSETDGLVVDNPIEVARLVRYICEERDNMDSDIDVDDFLDKILSLGRRDSLGYDTIIY